jgi:hypothetical protein
MINRSIIKRFTQVVVLAVLGSIVSSTQAAVTLVSNLANGPSEQDSFYTGRSLYQSFSTGSEAATIQGFKFSFGYVGTPTTIGVSVYSDISGGVGSSLGSFTAVDPSSLGGGYSSVDFTGSLGVNANSSYWLVLSATGGFDGDGNYLWMEQNYVSITSGPDETGISGWTLANSHWNGNHLDSSSGGFGEYAGNPIKVEITGAPVPEPSVACLLGLGLGALALVRRRSRA